MSTSLLTQARLAQAVYNSSNRSDTATIDGWSPVWVDTAGLTLSSTFGAQLYERDGYYTLAFRGTQSNLSDWAQNIRYGMFSWSDEFADTIKFAVRSMQQIAQQTHSTLALVSDRFQTTGHSQGGFEAELASTLLGIPGSSFDGMGAHGVAQQFSQLFDGILKEMGAHGLVLHTPMATSDFLTRIYSVVGRLGLHTGVTENAWSWKLTQGMTLLHPVTGLLTGASMVAAHSIADIVENEALRMRSKVWQWLGQSGISAEEEAQWIANDTVQSVQSVDVASNGDWLPAISTLDSMHDSLVVFLQSHSHEALSIEFEGDIWWITAETSQDVWRGFDDGSWLSITTHHNQEQVFEQRLANGELVQRITQTTSEEGWPTLREEGLNGITTASLHGNRWVLTLNEVSGHAEQQTWQLENGSWVIDERVVTSYSSQEIEAARSQAWLSAMDLINSLRQGDEWGALSNMVQLSHQVQIWAQQPSLWTQQNDLFIGALDVMQVMQNWDDAGTLQRIGMLAHAALSTDTVLRHLHPQQQGGFIESNAGVAALQTVAAWSQLGLALQTGNPLLLGQSFVAIQQSGAAVGWFANDFSLDPTSLIVMNLAQMMLSHWLEQPPESAAPPPWAHMVVNEQGGWVIGSAAQPGTDGELGRSLLEPLLQKWTQQLQAQASELGLEMVPQRMPEVVLEGFPSFDRHGVDNYWLSIALTHQVTGQPMGLAVHANDAELAWTHAALSAGVWVTLTEAETIRIKLEHEVPSAFMTWGQWLHQHGILPQPQVLAVDQRQQLYTLLSIDLGTDGILKKPLDVNAALTPEAVLSDTERGVARADIDHDGFLERTEWVEPNDAFLTIDLNGDGWLIGSDEWLVNQPLHSLAYWDANQDGWLTQADPVFEQLHLWIDLHADARHSPGEAWALSSLPINGIDLEHSWLIFEDDEALPIAPLQLAAEVEGIHLAAEHDAQGNTVLGQFTWQLEGQAPLLTVTQAESSIPGVSIWNHAPNHAPTVNALTQYTVPEDGIWSDNQDPQTRRRLWLPDFLNQVSASDAEGSAMAFGDFTQLQGIEHIERIDTGVMITLEANQSGPGGFDFRVTDGQGGWSGGHIALNVTAQNDAPWLTGLPGWPSQTSQLNGWFETRIFAFDIDSPPEALQTSIDQQAVHGNLTLSDVEWSVWQGSQLANGVVAGQWDLGYRFRYGDPYTGPVQATLEVSDDSGGTSYSSFQTIHQGSQALKSGKPVAIDWNQDGELHINDSPSEWVTFDFNAVGSRDVLAWIDQRDAWLAVDLNHNQQIDNGSELNFKSLSDEARTDLEGLNTWDSDSDGWLTSGDPMWNQLGVWHDANSNAITDAGEWHPLNELKWQSISLASDQHMSVAGDAHVFGATVALDEWGLPINLWDVALPVYSSHFNSELPPAIQTPDWASASVLGEILQPSIDYSQVWAMA